MPIRLKTTKSFTDEALVSHNTGFLGIYETRLGFKSATIVCGIWKNKTAFLDSVNGGTAKPIKAGIEISISGNDFDTYFGSSVSVPNSIVPANMIIKQGTQFLLEKKPSIPLIQPDDWEEDV